MRVKPWILFSLAVSAAMALAGWLALRQLGAGATLPTHWNAAGEVDGRMAAGLAVWLIPAMTLIAAAVLAVIPRIEPLQDRLAESAPVLRIGWAGMLAVLGCAQALIVAPAFGWMLPGSIILVVVGGMFVALGNVLPKSRPGFFVGIRTPWTLTDPDNWIATHRLGGKCFMGAGLVFMLAAMPATPAPVRLAMVLGAAALSAGVPMAYSWYLWREAGGQIG